MCLLAQVGLLFANAIPIDGPASESFRPALATVLGGVRGTTLTFFPQDRCA